MKLSKLQKLAEGAINQDAYGKINKIFDPLHDKLESAHEAIEFIRNQLQSAVLNDLLKAEGFPATEAKAAKDAAAAAFKAIKDLEDEISDLHQAIGTHFDTDLNEAKKALTPKAEKKIVTKVISNAEDGMPYEYRYKSYDVLDDKTVHWVTQQTSPKESAAVAQTLVRMLRNAGVKGWTVKVVIRDDYIGDKTKWHAKLKS